MLSRTTHFTRDCYNTGAMYYGSGGPEREPHWWEEVWVLSRAVFGILFWPLVALFGAVIGVFVIIYLFAVSPLLGLAAIVAVIVAGWLYSRWDRGRSLPPQPPTER